MRKILLSNMNIFIVFFLIFALLTSGVSASKNDDKKKNSGEELCDDDNSEVTEEIAGVTNDGKELLVKRTVKHFKNEAKTSTIKQARTTSCYSLMGVKWATLPVTYTINPSNTQGLTQDFIVTTFSKSAETWDAATSKELFNNVYTVSNSGVFGVYDGKNTLVFGNNDPDARTIAVTSTWYTSISRRIVDFDISFEENYQWGNATLDSSKMDVQNIATHELGHGIGLNDLYNSCTLETMFGYSGYGEIIKRTLNTGDIAGLKAIYR